jgi:hypothetical protein
LCAFVTAAENSENFIFKYFLFGSHLKKKKKEKKNLSETRAKLHNVIEAKRKKRKRFSPSNLIGDLLV